MATRAWYNLPVINEKVAKFPLQGVVKNIVFIGGTSRRGKGALENKDTKRHKNKGKEWNTNNGQDKGWGGYSFGWKKIVPWWKWKPYS